MNKQTLRGSTLALLIGLAHHADSSLLTPDGRINVPATLIPKGYLVLNQATVKLRMSDQRFGRMKIISAEGKQSRDIAVNEQGEPVDIKEILREDKRAYVAKYGKISPVLYDKIENSRHDELFLVAVWVAVEDDPVKPKTKELNMFSFNYLLKNQAARENLRKRLDQEHIKVFSQSQRAPVLYLEVTPKQIRTLNTWPDVTGIFLHETEGVEDLATSLAISNAEVVIGTWGWDGSGVSVCVWDNKTPYTQTDLEISSYYDPYAGGNSNHPRLVTGIIRNTENNAPHGYAPAATIYLANSGGTQALEWCLNSPQDSTVVNQSFHGLDDPRYGDPSSEDILKDYLVLQAPYPTIVQAAGNLDDGDNIYPPEDEFVNHKGYNSLTVGNHNDSATAIANDSVFRNPNSTYGDRELPELCANGENITLLSGTHSGTSFSSPAVAGTVALLQEVDNLLFSWPEGSRAILLASATLNVSGDTWQTDRANHVDARDGSGALNTEEAVQIATNQQSQNNSAAMRGWDAGSLDDSDFDQNNDTTFLYNIQVPTTGETHVKVALAWDSKVTTNGLGDPVSSALAMDLDLRIEHNNNLQASSSSYDNSYEIVEFDGVAGETYTVKINRASGAGESTWYGLAWTVSLDI